MPSPDAAVQKRRAIGLIVLTVFLPGAAQFAAGNRRLGRVALRTLVLLVAAALLVGLGLLFWRGPTVGFLLNGPVTIVMRVLVWLVVLGWLVLLFDAWRLARPPSLPRRARLVLTASCLLLALLAGLGTNLLASAFTAAGHVGDVFPGGGDSQTKHGRYNVLLLGVDAAADREGIRPDSINVASIDANTGRAVVFGLPRNLMGAPFPSTSPLAKLYLNGFRCGEDCMLNGVYTLGQEHADLYPRQEAGLAATKEVVSELLGLELNYYAMVDISGFQRLIDTMGGITLDIGKQVPIGGVGSEIYGWIEPGKGVHLDGYHALWFARSRAGADDYERMVRQKCVMSAMAKQLDPSTVAAKFVDLAEAGSDIVRTDVGTEKLPELVDLAIRGKSLPIDSVNFSPPLIDPASPDLGLIRSTTAEAIAASEAQDSPSTPATSSGSPASSAPVPSTTSASGKDSSPNVKASDKTEASDKTTSEATSSPTPEPGADVAICRVS